MATTRGEYTLQLATSILKARANLNEHLAVVGPDHPSTSQARKELQKLRADARFLFHPSRKD